MQKRAAVVSVLIITLAALLWVETSSSRSADAGSGRPTGSTRAPAESLSAPRAPAKTGGGATRARELFVARWGGGAGELGRERPAEGNAVGPMSFGADGRGRVRVLDGVNGRVVRRGADGAPEGSFPIGVTNPEDIAVADDGTTAVLDRHRDKSVALFDPSGKPRGTLPVEGTGISDVGRVTSVLIDRSDVYVERAHGPLVKIGDLAGTPAEPRSEIPGRPSRDGLSFLNAGITDAGSGRVWVASIERASETHRFTRELRLGALVRAILLLDTDEAGTIYFAAELENATQLYCLDRQSGAPIGSATLPVNALPEESFRDLVVLDAGGVIHALRSEQGVSYSIHRCL